LTSKKNGSFNRLTGVQKNGSLVLTEQHEKKTFCSFFDWLRLAAAASKKQKSKTDTQVSALIMQTTAFIDQGNCILAEWVTLI
jgi:hypothetical protein